MLITPKTMKVKKRSKQLYLILEVVIYLLIIALVIFLMLAM